MNIYKVVWPGQDDYDQFSNFVVIAESEEDARHTHPNVINTKWVKGEVNSLYAINGHVWRDDNWGRNDGTWRVSPKDVAVELLGVASEKFTERTVVCASFHAS